MQNDLMATLINLGNGFKNCMLEVEHIGRLLEQRCNICHDEFNVAMLITRTPCAHIMYYHCLVPCFFEGKCFDLAITRREEMPDAQAESY